MQYIVIPFITLVVVLGGLIGAYNYMPLSVIEPLSITPNNSIGTTITTINGTDTLSSSRTTINNNFSALNSGKIEVSSSSIAAITTLTNLSSVGTITTGNWNADVISVSKGGTGTTSPTLNQVLLGSGSSIGIKVVSGFGTSGQFLTSNGVGFAPTWQTPAVNQGIDYNWTGINRFTTLHASSTLTINGIALKFPPTQGIASSTLTNDGSGNLNWSLPSRLLFSTTTDVAIGPSSNSSTTVITTTVPGGWLGKGNVLRFKMNSLNTGGKIFTAPYNVYIEVIYGSQSNTYTIDGLAAANFFGTIEGTIQASATNAQEQTISIKGYENNTTFLSTTPIYIYNQGGVNNTTVDSTSDQTLTIKIRNDQNTVNDYFLIDNSYVELLGY